MHELQVPVDTEVGVVQYIVFVQVHEVGASRSSLSRISIWMLKVGLKALSLNLWGSLFPFSGLQDQCN